MNILKVLETAGRDLLIERRGDGWHVEAESPCGEGYACDGVSLADALGQVSQALALDLDIRTEHDDDDAETVCDADQRIPYTIDPPVEFCTRFVTIDHDDELRAVGQ